jgi:hypothetical protein
MGSTADTVLALRLVGGKNRLKRIGSGWWRLQVEG